MVVNEVRTAAVPEAGHRLDCWEEEVQRRLPEIDLLGELGLTGEDRSAIATDFRKILDGLGVDRGTGRIDERWPMTLAAYLAAEGMAGYQGGNFWDTICGHTGLPHAQTSSWGRIFERALKTAGKPTFSQMIANEHATRYVAPILAHGGIPNSCLDDFFRHVLQHSGRRERWGIADADELIAEWRGQRNPLPFADKPVRRFLIFGGAVARDFLDRCLEMARVAAEGGAPPPVAQLGLPERVVSAYRSFLSKLSPEERQQPRDAAVRSGARFVRPFLRFDPWGGGVEVFLPEQTLPEDFSPVNRARRTLPDGDASYSPLPASSFAGDLQWTITAGGAIETLRAPVMRRGRLRVSDRETLWLPRPAESYTATIAAGGERLRQWELPGLTARRPFLLFSPTSGHQLDAAEALPAELVWLISARGQALSARRTGERTFEPLSVVEDLPDPVGAWAGYRAIAVDLRGYSHLEIRAPGMTEGVGILIRVPAPELPRPHLAGLDPVLREEEVGEGALYADGLPDLMIPLGDGDADAARWQIHMRPAGTASPAAPLTKWLVEMEDAERTEAGARVPLTTLLGDHALGTFRLVVRGPLGQDAILTLRAVRHLRIEGAERLVLPDDEGGITVTTDAGARLIADGDDVEVGALSTDIGGLARWLLTPAPGARSTGVRYLRAGLNGSIVEVPVRVPVHRLRWGLLGIEDTDTRLSGALRLVDRDTFDQAVEPRCIIEAPAGGRAIAAQIALCGRDEELHASDWARVPASDRLIFPLGAFRDSVRAAPGAAAAIELRLRLEEEAPIKIPLARIMQPLAMERLDARLDTESSRLVVAWEARHRVPYRALLIWSLRRHWEPPLLLPIPDEVESAWSAQLDPPLPPGRYRVAIALVDPWTGPSETRLPRPNAANVADVVLRSAPGVAEDAEPIDEVIEHLVAAGAAVAEGVRAAWLDLILPALLAGEIRRVYGDAVQQVALAFCLSDTTAFLRAVAALTPLLAPVEENALVDLFVRAGAGGWSPETIARATVDAALAEDLWRIWPPFGLFLDLSAAQAGDADAAARCRAGLGPSALDALDADSDEGTPDLASVLGTPVGLARLLDTPSSAARLLKDWKADLRGGLLGGARLVHARYEYISRIDSDSRIKQQAYDLLSDNLFSSLDRVLRQVESQALAPRCILEELRGRRDAGKRLENLPFLVGLAALLQRLQARQATDFARLPLRPTDPADLGRRVFRFAPSLYARDLCFADLSLRLFR